MRLPVDSDCRIFSYGELIATLVDRRKALGLSQFELTERAGLQEGYAGKLEAWRDPKSGRGLGPVSFELVLRALGLAIVLVDDAGTMVKRAAETARPGLNGLGLRGGGLGSGAHLTRGVKRPKQSTKK